MTEIGRDGTMSGPDTGQLQPVLDAVRVPVIASGGVGTLDDPHTRRVKHATEPLRIAPAPAWESCTATPKPGGGVNPKM